MENNLNNLDSMLKRSANSLTDIVNIHKSQSSGFLELQDESFHNFVDIEMQNITDNVEQKNISNIVNTNNDELKIFNMINNIRICFMNVHQNEKWSNFMKQVIHYYTHFLLFVIFEILFYFNYIAPYEERLVYQMLKSVLDDLIKKIFPNAPIDGPCDHYSYVCDNFVNGSTNKHNTIIYQHALYLIYGLSGFLILLIIIETNIFLKKSEFPKEFMKSIYLMIYVGIFDYLLFNFFILEYKIIDPPTLMCDLYENGGYC